jgi:uncharacterized membrane protein YhaH (DUF805 family)
MNKKMWFKRKLYGWGWTPATWEGWLIILLWIIILVSLVQTMDHEWFKNIIFIIIMTSILIFICYKKGEKPKWQWGQDKIDN